MAIPWSHTYTTTEEMFTSDCRTNFISAINERLMGIGRLPINLDAGGKPALAGWYSYPNVGNVFGNLLDWADEVRNAAGQGTVLSYNPSNGLVQTDIFGTFVGGSWTYHNFFRGDPTWVPVVGESCVAYGSRAAQQSLGIYGTAYPINPRGYHPKCSWKALQSAVYNLAAFFYTGDEGDRTGVDIGPPGQINYRNPVAMPVVSVSGNYTYDFAHWPAPTGFTRYQEPITSSTAYTVGFAAGDRARFVFNNGSFITIPVTPTADKKYSGKIMKLVGGVWTLDADQTTPLIMTTNQHGIWSGGDIATPQNLNELRNAINGLHTLVLPLGGGLGTPLWDTSEKLANTFINSSPGTGVSAADAFASVEANYAAVAEPAFTNGSFPGYSTSGGGPIHGVGNMYYITDQNIGLGGIPWSSRLKTGKVRLNSAGFQNGMGQGVPHTFQSSIDIYASTDFTPAFDGINEYRDYDPPIVGMVKNQWYKTQSIGPNANDVRVGNTIGANVVPTRPTGVHNERHYRGYDFNGYMVVQRFKVAGGFQYV